jgi:glycosyltransferase involved in cell wall biosynthesis
VIWKVGDAHCGGESNDQALKLLYPARHVKQVPREQMAPSDLTILVCAFNEEAAISSTLEDLRAHVPAGCEILVIDGGRDRTGEIVRSMEHSMPGLRHVAHTDDRGKGHAVRTGTAMAKGRFLVQFDADGQFLASDIPAMLAPLEAGTADITLGSRFLPQSGIDAHASLARNAGNLILSGWASLLFGHRMTDVLAGLKAWTAEAGQVMDLQSDRFEYEVEIPSRGLRRGLRVMDVPISTRCRAQGESKVPVIRTGLRVLTATARFRWEP